MCPCNQSDGYFTVAFLVTAAIVLAVSVLRGHWPTMRIGARILSVLAIALVACFGLVSGSRGGRSTVCPLPPSSEAASTAPATDLPASSAPAAESYSQPTATTPAEDLPFKVVAYYFHRTARCHTCLTIEELSKRAIENSYAAELAGGLVEWRSVNIEEKGNEHFEKDYDLAAQSLILVRQENRRQMNWKNLVNVWKLVEDPFAFDEYVRTEVAAFLDGNASVEQ